MHTEAPNVLAQSNGGEAAGKRAARRVIVNCREYLTVKPVGARWLRGQCDRRAIAEAKLRSRWSVIG
jgi:hypothetical protein